jgi:DNA-damage-inducible protein J
MAQVSFRMEDDLKASADALFRSMGMTMSAAINIFVAQTVRRGEFPFAIKGDPFYSEPNMAVLRRRAADMDAGRHLSEHDPLEAESAIHA